MATNVSNTVAPYTLYFGDSISQSIIWALALADKELLAGMLAAGMGIMDDLNTETSKALYYVDSDADVSAFRAVADVVEDDVRTNSVGHLTYGEYGIWLKSSKRFYYSLYIFTTNAFFQGILSMSNAFGVDFRNYLYGFPFDGFGNQYALNGYILAPYLVSQDAFDLDDIEAEEADDENIIEPLARTDEIITIKDE